MDPNATFTSFYFAHAERDFEGAREFAEDLAAWLVQGGVEPTWYAEWTRESFFAWLNQPRTNARLTW